MNRSLIDRIIRCGNASVRENTRNSARSFRVSPLCLQTSGFCPSLLGLHFSSHSLLVCPPVPSSRRFFTVLPHRSLSHSFFLFLFVFLVSLLTPSPARWAKKGRGSLRVVSPHYRPLPSRPLRFKSPCGGGGREDVNFTWHGNASATAMLNAKWDSVSMEACSEISFAPSCLCDQFCPCFYIKRNVCPDNLDSICRYLLSPRRRLIFKKPTLLVPLWRIDQVFFF